MHGQSSGSEGMVGYCFRSKRTVTVLCCPPAGVSFVKPSCHVQMGNAVAEAAVRAGLQLVPYSFTGESEAVAIGNIGVSGIPVELVPPEVRQQALEDVRRDYPGLIIVDYTLPQAVNGVSSSWRHAHLHVQNLQMVDA